MPNQILDSFLDDVAMNIFLNTSFCNHLGLNGKSGAALFLFNYARLRQNEVYHDYANDLLLEIGSQVGIIQDHGYLSGTCGISRTFEYLERKDFVDLEGAVFMKGLKKKALLLNDQMDYFTGMIGQGIYLFEQMGIANVDDVQTSEDVVIYEKAISLINALEAAYKNHLTPHLKRWSDPEFDPVNIFDFKAYVNSVFFIARSLKLLSLAEKSGLCPVLVNKLIKDYKAVAEIVMEEHYVKGFDGFRLSFRDDKERLGFLNVISELGNACRSVSQENREPVYQEKIRKHLRECCADLSLLTLNERLHAAALLQASNRWYPNEENKEVAALMIADIDQVFYVNNKFNPTLFTTTGDPNIGVFNGWSKVGLVLQEHLYPGTTDWMESIELN